MRPIGRSDYRMCRSDKAAPPTPRPDSMRRDHTGHMPCRPVQIDMRRRCTPSTPRCARQPRCTPPCMAWARSTPSRSSTPMDTKHTATRPTGRSRSSTCPEDTAAAPTPRPDSTTPPCKGRMSSAPCHSGTCRASSWSTPRCSRQTSSLPRTAWARPRPRHRSCLRDTAGSRRALKEAGSCRRRSVCKRPASQ